MSEDALPPWLLCKADVDALNRLKTALWIVTSYAKSGADLRNLGLAIMGLDSLITEFINPHSAFICADLRKENEGGGGFEFCITPTHIVFNTYEIGWIDPVQRFDGADGSTEYTMAPSGGFDLEAINELETTLHWMDASEEFVRSNEKQFFSNDLGYPV